MAYQVLLVDDEMPALHLLQRLIEKYAPDFRIVQMCNSADAALAFLRDNPIDVLMTDISMPRMNGIDLAKTARKLQPDIHIVIISGYAEFEYAQGAIQAAVDEYLLKPINGSQMKRIVDKLTELLDEERGSRAAALLPALACGLPYSKQDLMRYFVTGTYRFALIRWGGIDPRMSPNLRASSLVLPIRSEHYTLRGRDDEEQILIYPAADMERFLSDISVYMAQRFGQSTWTVIYQPQPHPIVMLDQFLNQALPMLHRVTVVGRHQILPVALPSGSGSASSDSMMSVSDLNQLQFYCSTGRYSHVKEFFQELADTMEADSVPEAQVYQLTEQIVLQLAGTLTSLKTNYQNVKNAIADLFPYASSYSDLMSNVYAVLFENEAGQRSRKLSTRELYDSAVQYIEQNYASPLSVQSVCDELNISPTYLSRLFRKYGDTTFNTFLMKQRMEAAIVLLTDKPDMLLRDVAACVGYEDSSYFAKVFYQYTGKRPSQYAQK